MEKVSRKTKLLHWVSVIFIGLAYLFIELRVLFEKGTLQREVFKNIHYGLGFFILVLSIVRLIEKRKSESNYTNQSIDINRRKLMNRTHQGFLFWFCVMAILGLLQILPSWGLPELPYPQLIKSTHQRMGQIGYFLIAMHTSLVFYHHFWLKDDVLKRYL